VTVDAEPSPAASPGRTPIRETVALLGAMLLTRGELAALELDDARRRAFRCGALALGAAILALGALVTVSLLTAALFWDTYRWQALLVLLAVYAGAAIALVARLRTEWHAAPPLLETTLAELKRDGDALRSAWQ
jgi:uncharacterized membrane protein YqjE